MNINELEDFVNNENLNSGIIEIKVPEGAYPDKYLLGYGKSLEAKYSLGILDFYPARDKKNTYNICVQKIDNSNLYAEDYIL